MARTADPNSARDSFSILLGNSPHLDGKYTVFGKVVRGMDVVDAIAAEPTGEGLLADRFSKRKVIVGCKLLEMFIMTVGIVAIMMSSLPLLLVAVAMMGAQSALFSPSRLGSIPETVKSEKISAANGVVLP